MKTLVQRPQLLRVCPCNPIGTANGATQCTCLPALLRTTEPKRLTPKTSKRNYAGTANGATQCLQLPVERMPSCPVVEDGVYTVSNSGYRLTHADKCSGAEQLLKDTDGAVRGVWGTELARFTCMLGMPVQETRQQGVQPGVRIGSRMRTSA